MNEINYYSSNSDVTLERTPLPEGSRWRPGAAGLTERVAAGNGQGDGWLLYFYERWLIAELWVSGAWITSRHLDCSPLLRVGGTRHRNLVAFGWNKINDTISFGCVTRDADNPEDAAAVHADFPVYKLAHVLAPPTELHLGGAKISAGNLTTNRTLDARVSTVAGRVINRNPLTRGELARLAGREARYAD
ncbi:hypothetical protein Dxin01_00171 [Deinococcus xinjiangensis]|uniref:Uncharacterized protein n=1 Tax=Deinococcus xinjiangensis TaxID=457454 RepID=A0ABP9V8E9_9DEIO